MGRWASHLVVAFTLFTHHVVAWTQPIPKEDRVAHVGAASNDAHDIQAVVDKVAKLGGGTVQVAEGRYKLQDSLRLRSGVKIVGVPGETVFIVGPGRKTALERDVAKGGTEVTLTDATGFEVGDGIALEDAAGHGFEVTTATLGERLGPKIFRLSRPAECDYLISRHAKIKRAYSAVGGWNVRDAALEGVTIQGNHGQTGSEYLGGCRGAGIYLFACENVTIRRCVVQKYNGDAISFQKGCQKITIADCLCENNSNVGMHPGSDSHSSVVRNNILRKNGYVGLFVCVGVKKVLFEGNEIVNNAGCGISIGLNDTDNVFRGNRVANNAETGILFRRDSLKAVDGAHRNLFEKNIVKANLGPRPDRSNSRPGSAGRACVVIEGPHHDLVFRDNDFGFSQPHSGAAILHDSEARNLQASQNRLHNLKELKKERPNSDD